MPSSGDIDPALSNALERFALLEERERSRALAQPAMRAVFDDLIAGDRELLKESFADDTVTAALDAQLNDPESEDSPLKRLALVYETGRRAVSEEQKNDIESFLGRDVETVASELIGVRLVANNKSVTITETRAQDLTNLLLDDFFAKAIQEAQEAWRNVVSSAVQAGIPVPAMSAALSFYDAYRSENLPANLLQAQRDYFGAHTYERNLGILSLIS